MSNSSLLPGSHDNALANRIRAMRDGVQRATHHLAAARDQTLLLRRHPALFKALRTAPLHAPSGLQRSHKTYTEHVSTLDMAMSLEAATLLWALCRNLKPRRVLDLGSGFSTYLLASFSAASTDPPDVVSIDDSRYWLDQTARYIASNDLPQPKSGLPPLLDDLPNRSFDIVSYDFSDTVTRASLLPRVATLLDKTGVLLLDDMHKPRYARAVKHALRQLPGHTYSLHPWTIDSLGRFCAIWIAA